MSTSNCGVETSESFVCNSCGTPIRDQYLLRVSPDLAWHAACLKCCHCRQSMEEGSPCFVRNGKTYCKTDYSALFASRCSGCDISLNSTDLVMRYGQQVYHVECFRCILCSRLLKPGDEFALNNDSLFCRNDFCSTNGIPFVEPTTMSSASSTRTSSSTGTGVIDDVFEDVILALQHTGDESGCHFQQADDDISPLVSSKGSYSSSSSLYLVDSSSNEVACCKKRSVNVVKKIKKSAQKTTRIRTVLNEKQLHTLRICYGANPRPDALMKDQLVDMTGLSTRVIRVWFQNKRCKDKKRTILLQQIQQENLDQQVSSSQFMASGVMHLHDVSTINLVKKHPSHVHSNCYNPPQTVLPMLHWTNVSSVENSTSSVSHQTHFHHLVSAFGFDLVVNVADTNVADVNADDSQSSIVVLDGQYRLTDSKFEFSETSIGIKAV